MIRTTLPYLTILSLLILSGCQSAQPQDERTLAVADSLNRIMAEHQLMGLSVLAVRNGEVAAQWHLGTADWANKRAMNEQTQYRIASISKSVTATALMILYDKGLFQLSDPVDKYLDFPVRNPRYPERPITIQMLLSHTSSLNDGEGYGQFLQDSYQSENPPTLPDLIMPSGKYYTGDMFLEQEPGAYFLYCNLNFGLIGTLIEKLSGMRFDAFCQQMLFDKLDMEASFNPALLPDLERVAVLYRTNNGEWEAQADQFNGSYTPRALDNYQEGTNGVIFGPQGSLRASANDLAKFMILHLNNGNYNGNKVLEPATVSLMHDAVWTYNGGNGDSYGGFFQEWGLGLQRVTASQGNDVVFPNVRMIGHSGEAYGLISGLYFDPQTKNGVIFLTNGSKNPFQKGTRSAFYHLEEEVYALMANYLGY